MLQKADIISPWSVGRYKSIRNVKRHAQKYWQPDIKWCRKHNLNYLPVVYPGFSWFNNKGGEMNSVPRLKSKFLWSQVVEARRAGAEMIYVAMFDEVDEGTAIFKCTNNPPTGNGGKFLTYEGLPSDYYLRLVGKIGEILRAKVPLTDEIPAIKRTE